MTTIEQRIEALEKLIAGRKSVEPWQFIVLDIGRDAPEEYERKQRQIAAIEAKGEKIIVFSVV